MSKNKSKSGNKLQKSLLEPLSDWDKDIEKYHEPNTKKGSWIKNIVVPGEDPYENVPKRSLWKRIFGK